MSRDAILDRTGTGLKPPKELYKGMFNLGSEIIIRRTYAKSEKQAKCFMLNRIIKEKGLVKGGWVYKLFDGTKDNYSVKKEDV